MKSSKILFVFFIVILLCANAQASTTRNKKNKKTIVNSIGMTFVYISPGSFMMGSKTGGSDERPVHEVAFQSGFYMQNTEVTQGQWRTVMGENPAYFNSCGKDCPVENVSWEVTLKFIKKLTVLEKGKYTYKLPSEAEWEYSCRAGRGIPKYFYTKKTNRLGKYAWYWANSAKKTHPVGKKKPNAWGLYDMHGNVWEWCRDWKKDYSPASFVEPGEMGQGTYRAYRGGSWLSKAKGISCSDRSGLTPSSRLIGLGFRIVIVPST